MYKYAQVCRHTYCACIDSQYLFVHTFWWGMIGMGESILGVAVGTGGGRLDLKIKQQKFPLNICKNLKLLSAKTTCVVFFNTTLHHLLKFVGCFSVLVVYFSMVSDSLLVADLILFWASRCVIPSVLTPSMAEMMSPWARLPPTALLPGVIYGGGQQRRSHKDH